MQSKAKRMILKESASVQAWSGPPMPLPYLVRLVHGCVDYYGRNEQRCEELEDAGLHHDPCNPLSAPSTHTEIEHTCRQWEQRKIEEHFYCGVQELAFGIWHLASGIWHLCTWNLAIGICAFGICHLAFDRICALGICAFGIFHLAFGICTFVHSA